MAIMVAAGTLVGAAGAQGAVASKVDENGQRPAVAVSPFDNSFYLTWLDPASNDPVFCPITQFKFSCPLKTKLKGAGTTDSANPPFIFAPKTPDKPIIVVQSRSLSTSELFAWNPIAGPTPVNLGFGSASQDAQLGYEGLNGKPVQATIHAIGTDNDGIREGFIHKGFPFGGTEDEKREAGLVLDNQHLANATITTVRDTKTGVDERPIALFDNNAEVFYAVGRHPSDPVNTVVFNHWNTAPEWLPTRKLVDGGSAVLSKSRLFTKGAFARTVYSDEEGRPTVATVGVDGLVGEPTVLGEYSTGAFGDGGADIQHTIATGLDGRTYVTWVAGNDSGPDSLLLAQSSNGGVPPYSAPVEIAQGEEIRNLSMRVGEDRGAIAWSATYSGSEGSPVFYLPFSTGGQKAGGGSASVRAAAKPFASKPAVKANGAVGNTGFATVLARNGCVTRGKAYRVRVLVGGPRGTKRQKVSRVAVTVAGRTRLDRKGPFSVTLSTRRLRKNSAAKVGVRLFRGRKTIKKLKYRLRTCR